MTSGVEDFSQIKEMPREDKLSMAADFEAKSIEYALAADALREMAK